MPYHIASAPGKFEVVDDAGKVVGTHPTRTQAVAQLQALYANVPEAKKEMTGTPTAVMPHGAGGLMSAPGLEEEEKATAEVNDLPDSAFLYVESSGEKDDGGKTVPRSLRH